MNKYKIKQNGILKGQEGIQYLSKRKQNLIKEGEDWLTHWLLNRQDILAKNIKNLESHIPTVKDLYSTMYPWYLPASDEVNRQLAQLYRTNYKKDKWSINYGGYTGNVSHNFKNGDLAWRSGYFHTNPFGTLQTYSRPNFREDPYIGIYTGNWNPNTIVHEQSHALGAAPQETQIKDFMENNDYLQDGVDVEKSEYWDDPTEIYSRRNEILKEFGKSPRYKYSKDDLDVMRRTIYKETLTDKFLNRYTDDFILKVLNDVADNSNKPDMTNIARNGGILKAQNGLGRIPIIGPIAKHAANRIISNDNVAYKGGASWKDLKSVFSKPQRIDDNKYHFLFGVDRPETTDKEAFNWENDIKENNYKNVKSYEGVLNPFNEYLFNLRNKGLIEELAKHRYTPLVNINYEYTDPKTGFIKEGTPIFDDVHDYRLRFHINDGLPVASASDLYDFGKNYSNGFASIYKERGGKGNAAKILEVERRLLNSVGQPYKLVQHNIPIRFVNNPKGNEIDRINQLEDQTINRLSDEDIAEITETGYIEPSIIVK